jgi:site-specific DNA-methyltransferase (cytosine-N4-specific)
MKSYIQPFEKQLAMHELRRLAGAPPALKRRDPFEFIVPTMVSTQVLADRLAYWEKVGDSEHLTTQVLREATFAVARNGIPLGELQAVLPFRSSPMLPNRRCLRYGPHGLHEYRGKFFPQLVPALLNWSGVAKGSVIADPMCGSGTAVVEAALLGCTAIGLDLNPLSVFISRTKCDVLRASPSELVRTYELVCETLANGRRIAPGEQPWVSGLPKWDQEYLRGWFSEEVLRGLEEIVACIRGVRARVCRDLLWACLSNILRTVSWQKEDDLRVRRQSKSVSYDKTVTEFLDEAHRSIKTLVAFLLQSCNAETGETNVLEGDARFAERILDHWRGRIDVVITSPPYATALPYLDTDRLSLIYLGLLPRGDHRQRDKLMIGNREISDRQRMTYWDAFLSGRKSLPSSVANLVEGIETRNANADVGFRRRNVGALLAKYFLDMRQVFVSLRSLLRRDGNAFVVVGSNHTYAGGERVKIDTALLLGELAESCGFNLTEAIPMEMLVSRDIFRKNAGESETILSLQSPQ